MNPINPPTPKPWEPPRSQLRLFGLLFSAFSLLLTFKASPEHARIAHYVYGVVFLLATLTLFWPGLLKGPLRIWLVIGRVLGKINTYIWLSLAYWILIVPLGLFWRLGRRKDRIPKESYRLMLEPKPPKTMERPF